MPSSHSFRCLRSALPLLCAAILPATQANAQQAFYRLQSAVTLPGKAPSWDYLTIDTARSRLFIGRRQGGVTVFDLATRTVLRIIARSEEANATTLVPEFDRGYTTNGDGSTTVFSLSTLETIDRIKFGGDADAAVFEPRTRQLAIMAGDSRTIVFLDARTGALTGKLTMPSEKLDGAVADGEGAIHVAQRDRNSIARIDAARRARSAEWRVSGCEQPTGLAIDRTTSRLFIGCRGAHPVLAVMDSRTGRVITTRPIGRGNDGVVYDAVRHQVLTSNGVDANLVIFNRESGDRYTLLEAPTTRPFARTMAFDERTGTIFLVTAEGTVNAARPVKGEVSPFYPNLYFDDTFALLTYSRR